MSSFDSYMEMMATWSSDFVDPMIEDVRNSRKVDEYEKKLFNEIFVGFTEISDTLETLILIGTLLKVSPPRSKKIDRGIYIKYLVGTYLQEVYILKERLNSYATKMSRLYSSSENKEQISERIKPVFEIVKSSFKDINNIRSSHVHGRRYTDKHLDSVSQMALISKFKPEFEYNLKIDYYLAKKEWSKTVEKNNKETKKILDLFFKKISLVTTREGQIILPNKSNQSDAQKTRASV